MSQLMTIARPYAEAAFQTAQANGQLQAWAEFLESLAVIGLNDDIQRLYHSPKIVREDLLSVIATLAKVPEDSPQANFVRILIEKKRLAAVAEIAKRFVLMQRQAHDMIDVNMVTAIDTTDAEKTGFAQKFAALLGRKIVLHCTTDKDILGGFVIRYGDKVIDSSIKGQLNKLATYLEC
jgi:F-type H+-transporting ATPase subunit delta